MKNKLKKLLIRLFSSKANLSAIYYFFTGEFKREQHAVLSGKYQYLKNNESNDVNVYLLRRNIHRIEKGLLMRPRRKSFAKDYILETVNNYKRFVSNEYYTKNDSKWFTDVLNEYFLVVNDQEGNIGDARRLFQSLKLKEDKNTFEKYIPYQKVNYSGAINVDKFLELAKNRRSVRWFSDKKVDRYSIDKALQVAGLSPTACNRQPYEYRVFDDSKLVRELANIPGGTKGYANNVPVMIAVVGQLEAYSDERDRHLIYVDSSLSAMSLIYALEIQGIGSCIINWPDVDFMEKKIKKFLSLKNNQRVIMLIAVGYKDEESSLVAYSSKKDLSHISRYNFEKSEGK